MGELVTELGILSLTRQHKLSERRVLEQPRINMCLCAEKRGQRDRQTSDDHPATAILPAVRAISITRIWYGLRDGYPSTSNPKNTR